MGGKKRKMGKNKLKKLRGKRARKKRLEKLKPKTWRDLHGMQKYRVSVAMREEFARRYKKQVLAGEWPDGQDDKIIGYLYYKFKDTTCWLTYDEVKRRYMRRKAKLRGDLLKRCDRSHIGAGGGAEVIFLGTGSADSLNRFNTSFIIRNFDQMLLVDCGGGAGILKRLKKQGIGVDKIRNVFVSAPSMDKIYGALWLLRALCETGGGGDGVLSVFGPEEALERLQEVCRESIGGKFDERLGARVRFVPVGDGEDARIAGMDFTFFGTDGPGGRLGFSARLPDAGRLVFLGGGEPARGADWLVLEAYCLESERGLLEPGPSGGLTVEEACRIAEDYNVGHLVLVGSADGEGGKNREKALLDAGKRILRGAGRLYVPSDGARLSLRRLEGEA